MQKLLCCPLEFQRNLAALLRLVDAVDDEAEILLCGVDAVRLHDGVRIRQRGRLRRRHEDHLVRRKNKVHHVASQPRACINEDHISTRGTVGELLLQEQLLCTIVFKSLLDARAA